jgi:nicotinamidase-related amidase
MGNTALLLLDLQQGILESCKADTPEYLRHILEVLSAARSAEVRVIYVRTCFRRGLPELSQRNRTSARVASHGRYIEGEESVDIPHSIAPLDEDIVVAKRRVSAFAGSDLEVVLRSLGVESLAIAGLSTSGAVLSTVRQAADLDFSLTVLEDLCTDPNAEVHKVLMEHVFPRQARVFSAKKWIVDLSKAN